MLRVLRAHGWSPRVFGVHARDIIEQLTRAPLARRPAWSEALERVLAHHGSDGEAGLCFSLGVAAMRIADWGLAEQALRRELLVDPGCAASWANLGRCAWELGRAADAEAAFAWAAALEPWSAATRRSLAIARRRRRHLAALGWWTPAHASDGVVLLEPMAEKHAAAFFAQCRGASVVERTPLRRFDSVEEVTAHLAAVAARREAAAFAVVERRFGLVGELSLERGAGETAELSFWIGEPFQGRGYGTRAARLGLALAARLGLREVTAEVAPGNLRSLRALVAAGARHVRRTGASGWGLSMRPVSRSLAAVERALGGEQV
jgi:RimJ/RimL family protein N-acetyltransferase